VDDRARAWLLLCEDHHRHDRYAPAVAACEQANTVSPGVATSFLRFLKPLESVPPLRWDVSGLRVPLVKDRVGNRRVTLSHPSGPTEAVVDTGAEISVLMASVARRLGVRPLGSASVGTATTPVDGGLALLDSVTIGTGRVLHVPVVVLPDEQLSFPDGNKLPAVLSLSALVAAGKAAFLDHGQVLALGDAVPAMSDPSTQLYWDPSGVGFEVEFARGSRAVHLDTGSVRNHLFPTVLPSLGEAEAAARRPFERKVRGIGGERTEQAFRLPQVSLRIAGQEWSLAHAEMAPADENGESATVGAPLLDRFEVVVLDFERMRMFVR
jgi:hypothetical protein